MGPGARGARPRPNASKVSRRDLHLTNVSLLAAAILGAVGTAFLYGVVWTFGRDLEIPLYTYFFEEGPIPLVTAYAFWMACGILVLKTLRIYGENRGRVIGDEILRIREESDLREPITAEDAARLIPAAAGRSSSERSLMVVGRIDHALRRLEVTRSASEVDEILRAQSDVDRAVVSASYIVVRSLGALIPVLGFLGTVWGISFAITNFTAVLAVADSFAQVKPKLADSTTHLGLAFDTTLVALVFSGILLFLSSLVEKKEEELLSEVDEYCLSRIVSRLRVVSADTAKVVAAVEGQTSALEIAVEAQTTKLTSAVTEQTDAFADRLLPNHVKIPLDTQTRQLEELLVKAVERIETVESVLRKTGETVKSEMVSSAARIEARLDQLVRVLGGSAGGAPELAEALTKVADGLGRLEALEGSLGQLEGLNGLIERLEKTFAGLRPAMEGLSSQLAVEINEVLTQLLRVAALPIAENMNDQKKAMYRSLDIEGTLRAIFGDGKDQ